MSLNNPFETLVAINEQINTIQDSVELLDRVLDLAIESMGAERGFILLKKDNNDLDYDVVAARNISKENALTIRQLSSSVVNQVLESGKGLISLDAQTDERFKEADSVILQQIKSVICTPLRQAGQLIGAIYMDSRIAVRQFDEASLKFLEAFASQSAIAISNLRLLENLQTENKRLKKQMQIHQLFPEIIGKSQAMIKVFEMIRDVADSTASVLIEGESGTGKELVARALHFHSSRKDQPFIPIFCGSLSENILESELFGHKKGAFTGATENKIGLFEEADKGTIFLDEIADISLNTQTKLLRIIQDGEIKRVGESQIRHVDVRIISATNKELWKEVEKGNFREDLYYRLNVINIKMPPLRERNGDIPLLADNFMKYFAEKNKKSVRGFDPAAMEHLFKYHWPGNVRELENAIERAVILSRNTYLTAELFQFRQSGAQIPLGKTLKEIDRYAILKTMEMVDNNRTKAAQILGVSRRWLQYQLKEWGMVNGD